MSNLPSFEINEEAQTLTHWIDRDTNRKKTVSFSELSELLTWLCERQDVLRKLVFTAEPLTIGRPMFPVNGFYVGMTEDRRPVKVRAERWQAVMDETARVVRKNWLFDQEERQRYRSGPVPVFVQDGNSQPLYPQPEKFTENDTPPFLIQQEQMRCSQPEWWVDREDNLDLGRRARLP